MNSPRTQDTKRPRVDGTDMTATSYNTHNADSGPSVSNRGSRSPAKLLTVNEFTLVSMNIAGCHPSKEAPRGWGQQDATEAITNELLRTDPDVLALQECPGGADWASRWFPGYQVQGATYSHVDQVMLLVRDGIHSEAQEGHNLPAVMAKLTIEEGREFLIASVHLEPFREGKRDRLRQMKSLIQTAQKRNIPLVIAGDTNMRVAEDSSMENLLHLVDLWKQSGTGNATKWTWDTKDHGTHFNRYYGDSTREYVARYDRVYVWQPPPPPPVASTSSCTQGSQAAVTVQSFELLANQPVSNKFHFLSDHFGISVTFQLK